MEGGFCGDAIPGGIEEGAIGMGQKGEGGWTWRRQGERRRELRGRKIGGGASIDRSECERDREREKALELL